MNNEENLNKSAWFDTPMASSADTAVTEGEHISGNVPVIQENTTDGKKLWDLSTRRSKILIGCLVSIVTAVAWVAFNELVKDVIDTKTMNAPFSLTYFFLSFPVLLFPGFLCVARLAKLGPAKDIFRECIHLYRGSEEFSRLQFMWKSCLFCFVLTITIYSYIRALHRLGAADCTALFAANHSFVYLLSWIVLFDKFIALRIFAMIFSITGIVLFAYVDGFGSSAMFGVVLGVASSAGTAVCGVLYKKFIGEASTGQALCFISVIGLLSLLFLWPVWLLLYLLGVEMINWDAAPWGMIISSAVLISVYWGVKDCAVHLTYTLFIGLGLVLAVPVCAAADMIWKGRVFSGMKTAALVLITVGVMLILLPEDWHEFICKRIRTKRRESEQQNMGNSTTLRGRLSRTSYM